jgi:hypothetical protein
MKPFVLCATALPALILAAKSCGPPPAANPLNVSAAPDASRIAWTLFTQVNSPADIEPYSLWETWATPRDLFVRSELGQTVPVWPSGIPTKSLEALEQQMIFHKQLLFNDRLLRSEELKKLGPEPGRTSEVRFNCSAFSYIVRNSLWHMDGVMQRAKAIEAGAAEAVDFHDAVDSVVIKAGWRKHNGEPLSNYHVYQDKETKWLLVALHIVSRRQPDWFWATWEHESNPPQPPMDDTYGFPGGVLSKDLEDQFKAADVRSEWKHYRLNGAQTGYTTPTIRANSVLEARFAETSSCMTCHARAAITGGGKQLDVFLPGPKGYTGQPQNSWYQSGNQPRYIRMGFLWSILTRARILDHIPPQLNYTCPERY